MRTNHLTNGALQATTQRAALMEHLVKIHGVELRNMTAAKVVEETLEDDDLDPVVRELLENRLKASATSPAKYKALLISSCVDGRLRGVLQFCGSGEDGPRRGGAFSSRRTWAAARDPRVGCHRDGHRGHEGWLRGTAVRRHRPVRQRGARGDHRLRGPGP